MLRLRDTDAGSLTVSTKTLTEWKADGSVWHSALPIAEITAALRTVAGFRAVELGILGDGTHLRAIPPEDHCPFSATGWPITSPYPYVHALDYSGPGWEAICAYWVAEARAGRFKAAKYINDGRGGQYSHWDGFTVRHANSDAGHVHLSIRSDYTHASIGGWEPLPPTPEEDNMTANDVSALIWRVKALTDFVPVVESGVVKGESVALVKAVMQLQDDLASVKDLLSQVLAKLP